MMVPIKSFNTDLDNLGKIDLFITALGFETRCTYVAEKLLDVCEDKCAIGFATRKILNYSANLEWFGRNQFRIYDDVQDDFIKDNVEKIFNTIKGNLLPNIAIDISAFNRTRIANLMQVISSFTWFENLKMHFLYNNAQYSPSVQGISANTHFGPVSPYFAGWTDDPDKPPIAILGLGYERGKALGSLEYLQADEAWAFIPKSKIEAYEKEVILENKILLDSIPKSKQIYYQLEDPFNAYSLLFFLVRKLSQNGRPIMLPFGPKIFSLISTLVSLQIRDCSVWRVSAQEHELPTDRLPSAHTCGLTIEFSNSKDYIG